MNLRLIFIYNAKGDFFNRIFNAAHKVISPGNYSCKLCTLTHSNFIIKSQWQEYLNSLNCTKEFYYREEWEQSPLFDQILLPVILFQRKDDERTEVLFSCNEMQQINSLSSFIEQMEKKLALLS